MLYELLPICAAVAIILTNSTVLCLQQSILTHTRPERSTIAAYSLFIIVVLRLFKSLHTQSKQSLAFLYKYALCTYLSHLILLKIHSILSINLSQHHYHFILLPFIRSHHLKSSSFHIFLSFLPKVYLAIALSRIPASNQLMHSSHGQ